MERTEKEQLKDAAEAPEKEALEKYRILEEELKAKKEEEKRIKEEADAKEAFEDLDVDNDNLLTVADLQTNTKLFDTNRDGEVSEDEAKVIIYFI